MYKLKIGETVVDNEITTFTENIVNAANIVIKDIDDNIAKNAPYVIINMESKGMKIADIYNLLAVDADKKTTAHVTLIDSDTDEELADLDEYNYLQSITRQLTTNTNTVVMTLYRFSDFNN